MRTFNQIVESVIIICAGWDCYENKFIQAIYMVVVAIYFRLILICEARQ